MAFFLTKAGRGGPALPRANSMSCKFKAEDLLEHKIPEESNREFDMKLGMLLNRAWQPRRIVISKEAVHFAFEEEEIEIDHIPLAELTFVKEFEKAELESSLMFPSSDKQGISEETHVMQFGTESDGHNSGRSYYIRADSKDTFDGLISHVRSSAKAARKRAEAHTMIQRAQHQAKKLYDAYPTQSVIILMIGLNFVFTIVESQYITGASHENGQVHELSAMLDKSNLFFVSLFLIELALNAFAHWFSAFFRNIWNFVDASLILMSFITELIPDQPHRVMTVLRAVRVIRIFGKVKPLRKVIAALAAALSPVSSVFFILFLLVSVGAVFGVAIFGEAVPESFATFDISLFTLFLVTAGEPWPEAMPRLNEDGTANWVVSLFCTAYTIVTFWLVLQVSFTVLLDNYIDASSTMAMQERLVLAEKQNREQQMKNPLEPLLLKLARDFSDDQDLSDRLHKLYQVLDSDKSGGLESAEFCAAMKKLDFTPRIHVTASDFASITLNGELCDETGQLGPKEFEAVMRKQMRHMAQSKFSLDALVGERTHEDLEFMQFGLLKMMFMEQTRAELDTNEIKACLYSIMRRISAPMPALGSFRRPPKLAETACPTSAISAYQVVPRDAVNAVVKPCATALLAADSDSAPMPALGSFRRPPKPAETAFPIPAVSVGKEAVDAVVGSCAKTLLAADSSFDSRQALSSNLAQSLADGVDSVDQGKSPACDSHHVRSTSSVIDAVKDLQLHMEKDTRASDCSYAAELNLPESSDSQSDGSSTASPDEVYLNEDLPSPYSLTNLCCQARDPANFSGVFGEERQFTDENHSGLTEMHSSFEATALTCSCEGDVAHSWKRIGKSNDSNEHCSVKIDALRRSDDRQQRRSSASNEPFKAGVKFRTEPVTGLATSTLCLHDFHGDEKTVTYGEVQVLRYSCRGGRTVGLQESRSSSLCRSSEFQVVQDIACNDQPLNCKCAEVALHSKDIGQGCCKFADKHNVRCRDCCDHPSSCARIQAPYDNDDHDSRLPILDDHNLLPWPCSQKNSGHL